MSVDDVIMVREKFTGGVKTLVEMKKLLDDIFDCMLEEELKILAAVTEPQIPGFTKKSIAKAPAVLLKTAAKQQLRRHREPDKLLERFIQAKKTQYDENETFDEFWWKLNNDKNITKMAQLLLLYFYHPDKYKEYCGHILGTDEKTQFDFSHFQQIPFAKRLRMQIELMDMRETMKWLQDEFSQAFSTSTEGHADKSSKSLKSLLEEQLFNGDFPNLGKGWFMNLYFHAQEEWKNWEESDKDTWLHLVIRDAVLYMHSLHNEMMAMKKQTEEIQTQMRLLEQEHERERVRWKNKLEKQEKQLRMHFKEMDEMRQEWETMIQNLKDSEAKATKLEEERNRLENWNQQMEQELSRLEGWLANETFVLVTWRENPLLSRILTPKQLKVLAKSPPHELDSWMDQAAKDVMYYIDISDFSTKEQFHMEAKLKERGIRHRMVSGNALTMIRKIIGYLEGVS